MQKLEVEEVQEIAEFEFQDLLGVGMTIIVLVIGLAYGAEVTSDVGDDMTADSMEKNITIEGLAALNKISVKLSTVVTIIIAAVIIGILVRHFWVKFA